MYTLGAASEAEMSFDEFMEWDQEQSETPGGETIDTAEPTSQLEPHPGGSGVQYPGVPGGIPGVPPTEKAGISPMFLLAGAFAWYYFVIR